MVGQNIADRRTQSTAVRARPVGARLAQLQNEQKTETNVVKERKRFANECTRKRKNKLCW